MSIEPDPEAVYKRWNVTCQEFRFPGANGEAESSEDIRFELARVL